MKLRAVEGGDFTHWCPGCESMHVLPITRGGWTFDGNLLAPTCDPSFKHEWREGNVEKCCHYVLTAGILNFCPDSTHALANKSVPLPDLPGDDQA